MSTLGDVLAYNLGLDTGALGNPETIFNNNLTVFAASGNVPAWLYTPLYISLGVPASGLHTVLIPDYGTASIPASPCVVIQPTELIESAELGRSNRSTTPGARTCMIDILIKNVSTVKDITLITNVTNRVVYLLDYYCRENRTSNIDFADLIIPDTISGFYQSPFKAYHVATYLPIAKEARINMRLEFYFTYV